MRIIVIGATGHIGTYLIPRLVAGGHAVTVVSRGSSAPYIADDAWSRIDVVHADREAEDAAGTFGPRIAALEPDAVIDLICFTERSASHLLDSLAALDTPPHLLHCGTIWTHGLSDALPLRENDIEKRPFGDYGVQKYAIERLLLDQDRVPSTVIHPGHISGPGWDVINPVGNRDHRVWTALATGSAVRVPGVGAEAMHHVHADDVAQLFDLAVTQPEAAIGHAFHAVARQALTVRGFAERAAAWFGREATLVPCSWEDFRASTDEASANTSWEHLVRNHVCSIADGVERLGYAPRYSADEAARQSVAWMIEHEGLDVGEMTLVER